MRLSAKTLSAMLIGLALTAFQSEMDAQSRGGSRSSSASRSTSSSSTRQSSGSTRQSTKSVTKQSNNNAGRPSGTVGRPSGQPDKPAANSGRPAAKPSDLPKPDISPADRNPSKPSVNKPSRPPQSGNKPAARPDKPKPNAPKPDYKPGNQHRPVGVRPPAARPPHSKRPPVYRPVYRQVYRPVRPKSYVRPVIIRPSYGSIIAADIAATMAWTAVNIAYFNTVSRTYDQISDNSETIAQQNALIAQNNATIAAQNSVIAQSQERAQQAYGLANGLGLVQSYADAGASYFYQDGVFYIQGTDGQYYVIVPPAGALVDTLPEDFEEVVLNGNNYYKVDNTIYQMTIVDGKPYFEVVGQMN